MRKRIRDVSLRVKVPVFFCLLLIVLVGIPCLYMYQYYYEIFSQRLDKSLAVAIETNAGKLRSLIGTIDVAINVVNNNDTAVFTNDSNTNLSTISEMMITFDPEYNKGQLYQLSKDLQEGKATFQNLFSTILSVAGADTSQTLIISEEYPVTAYMGSYFGLGLETFISNRGLQKADWYRETVQKGGEFYWFSMEEKPERLFLAKLLQYDYFVEQVYQRKNLGVVVISFDITWIAENINNSELTKETQIYVTDEGGRVLYASSNAEMLSQESVSELLTQSVDGEGFYRESNGIQFLMQKNELGHGLVMFTAIPKYDISQITHAFVKMIWIVMFIILAIGGFVISVLSKHMLRPIVHLATKMEEGNVEPVDDSRMGMDEIGLLYQGYNQQQNEINRLIREAWDSAEKQKRIEIRALQAQINPHFVFNTLISISCYCLTLGQDRIAKQLTTLSRVMRYNLRNPEALIPLRDEIDQIRKYEEIVKIGCERSAFFYYLVDSECEEILLPKLLIQPLVENAVVHGINLTNSKDAVTISVGMEEADYLKIMVEDTGTIEDINKINRYIRGECNLDTSKDSLGVRNVYERMRLTFGDQARFYFEKSEQGHTRAIIKIRLQKEQKNE